MSCSCALKMQISVCGAVSNLPDKPQFDSKNILKINENNYHLPIDKWNSMC